MTHRRPEKMEDSGRKVREMKIAKLSVGKMSAGLLAVILASGALAPLYAQTATKEQADAAKKTAQADYQNARLSSEHNAQMQQAYKAGEAAYAKGDYDKAVAKFKAIEAMSKNSPNTQ
jgi:hypothetical protein